MWCSIKFNFHESDLKSGNKCSHFARMFKITPKSPLTNNLFNYFIELVRSLLGNIGFIFFSPFYRLCVRLVHKLLEKENMPLLPNTDFKLIAYVFFNRSPFLALSKDKLSSNSAPPCLMSVMFFRYWISP